MPNLFRLVTTSNADLAGAEYDHHRDNNNSNHHHHHRHGLFSSHRHHDTTSPSSTSPADTHMQHPHSSRHGSHGEASPRGSSGHADTAGRSGSTRRANYPEALPSALSKRFTGPVQGTAVLDESTMPLEDAAILFEMVTPESTPLLKSHVKERFETAIEEVVAQRRQAARERAQREAEEEEEGKSDSPASNSQEGSSEAAQEPQHVRNNTFSFFKIDDSVASASQPGSAHHRRRHVLTEGGYVLFTDSYLSAHPNSVVTGVTSELQLAAADDLSPFHHRLTGPEAEKQKLQEVKDYIREVEHEYRPLFRRRTSAMVYGRGQYLHTSSPDLTSNEVYYATPIDDDNDKTAPEIKKEKTVNKLRRVFSSPLLSN